MDLITLFNFFGILFLSFLMIEKYYFRYNSFFFTKSIIIPIVRPLNNRNSPRS